MTGGTYVEDKLWMKMWALSANTAMASLFATTSPLPLRGPNHDNPGELALDQLLQDGLGELLDLRLRHLRRQRRLGLGPLPLGCRLRLIGLPGSPPWIRRR